MSKLSTMLASKILTKLNDKNLLNVINRNETETQIIEDEECEKYTEEMQTIFDELFDIIESSIRN
jgi:ribosome recycling factor